MELIVQKMPDSSTFSAHAGQRQREREGEAESRAASPPSSSASSCSEPDTEPDAHWDSGERIPYTRLADRAASPDPPQPPTLNPLYRSKADSFPSTGPVPAPVYSGDYREFSEAPPTVSFDFSADAEPMEYANDVFSSAPTSARESPVEECKEKRADDKAKPRLSLGDMRASWREFSGKFASDSRRRKDES